MLPFLRFFFARISTFRKFANFCEKSVYKITVFLMIWKRDHDHRVTKFRKRSQKSTIVRDRP
jgi:hypothetical protein